MLLGQEKKAIKQITNHIYHVEQCLKTAHQAVEGYFTDNIETALALIEQTHEKGEKATAVQHDIIAALYGGAFLPILREDVYNMVKSMGNLAQRADFFCRFLFYNQPPVPVDLKIPFKKMVQKAFDSIDPVRDGVLGYFDGYGKTNTVQHMAERMEKLAVEIAGMKCELDHLILSADVGPEDKILLKDCIEGIITIFSAAGKTADRMECITLKTGF